MKKLILLLLFIPLVSFGQEDVELNLSVKDSTESYFGIGFKIEKNEIFDKMIRRKPNDEAWFNGGIYHDDMEIAVPSFWFAS